jgi:hypothetical protein
MPALLLGLSLFFKNAKNEKQVYDYSGVNYFPGNSECGFSVLLFRKWEGVQPFSSINLQRK